MKHVHLIGIGGSGLSAIARLLKERGYVVSGSDRALTPAASQLSQMGIQVFIGHTAGNISGADLIVRSSAIADDNPEVQAALELGKPVLKRSEFLGELMADQDGIAVAGTHGKTTTTAMIAWMLVRLGQDPCYIIGGISKDLGGNAHAGRGRAFVIEADEYDGMFLGLQPKFAVITNLEHDHPDCFPTADDYRRAFAAFVRKIRRGGGLLFCADDPNLTSLADQRPAGVFALSYGLDPRANYRAVDPIPNEAGGFSFRLVYQPNAGARLDLGEVRLQVPGLHNVRNAAAALGIVHQLGLSMIAATDALAEFTGAGRRFDIRGEASQVTVIDDYAHHPTAIRATLAAARSRYPDRTLWAVWQPHTYSRTRQLLTEFASAFDQADHIIATEIYAAREAGEGFSAAQVIAQMRHPDARFLPTLDETARFLVEVLRPGDVLLILSAGDADQISTQVLTELKKRENNNAKS